MEDTIVGISTTIGIGAISILRISGKDAIEKINKITDINLLDAKSHTINYGYILKDDKVIDEVLISVMKSPKTYTKENIVEINCHGGISTIKDVLDLVLDQGIRLAEPGEFTKRAFLNGRINLEQAEGVMDLINSKTTKERELAINRVKGTTSNLIKDLRKDIVQILANIEVNIDFPEYEDEIEVTNDMIKEKTKEFELRLNKIIEDSENNRIIKEGIKTAIIGKPNVGKSSLLNALLQKEKAIVTDIPGTTRDFVEGSIIIDGILLNIIDTAGIRKTEDIVENIGVDRTLNLISEAELILLVFDNSEELTQQDIELLEKTKNKKRIIILNKTDINTKIQKTSFNKYIETSVIENKGIEDIKNEIKNMFKLGEIEVSDATFVANIREQKLLESVLNKITEVNEGLNSNMPIDMIEIDIKKIWEILGEITGETYKDELIDELFTNFCIGK